MVAGPGRNPGHPSADRPERALGFRLRRGGPHPARGDMVIGAFVLARLLGIRLLTLEARVVVHEDDRRITGPAPLVLAPVPAGQLTGYPAGSVREDPGSVREDPGSDPLARAMSLVEEGADTLDRTRRAQYRA